MTLALELLPSPEPETPGPSPPPAGGAFLQVLPGAVTAFCLEHGLDFDERALLEHLLDTADRGDAVVGRCTLSGLARDLGHGPSGRRTLAARLARLVAVGAIEWEPGSGCDPGRIEILVYRRLVRDGRGDRRAGYVQVVPGALAAAWARHDLTASARALLRRLVVDVDHRSHTLTGSVRQLTAHYGLGRQRLNSALGELVAAGLVRRLPERLELCAYDQLVRVAPAPVERPGPRSDRAPTAPESRATRVQNARPSFLLDARDQDLEPESAREEHAAAPNATQGQGGGCTIDGADDNLATLALALPEPTHHELLADPAQAPGRQALRRRLEALVAELGQADAVATMARDWPEHVDSAMALANNRAQRRLSELTGSATTAAGVADLAARQAARRRLDALQGARNLGQAWANGGATAEDVAAQFAGDEEAREAALAAFHAVEDTSETSGSECGPGRRDQGLQPKGAHGRRPGPGQGGPRRLVVSLAAVAGVSGSDGTPGWCPAETIMEGDKHERSVENDGRLPEPDGHHVRQRAAGRGALAV